MLVILVLNIFMIEFTFATKGPGMEEELFGNGYFRKSSMVRTKFISVPIICSLFSSKIANGIIKSLLLSSKIQSSFELFAIQPVCRASEARSYKWT
jgi:hypothetical protein